MKTRLVQFISVFLALLLSAIGALFGVLNILFSDVFGTGERLLSYAYVVGMYFVFGLVLTLLWPRQRRSWLRWLALPAVGMALLYTVSRMELILTGLGATSFAVVGAWAGVALGGYLRRSAAQTPPSSNSSTQSHQ